MIHRVAYCLSLVILIGLWGCAPSGFKIMPVPVDRSLKEIELYRDEGWVDGKIALIDVQGIIMNSPAPQFLSEGEHPVAFLVEKLDAARKDKQVKAVLLRINSPGGSVTASDIMHGEIMKFRKSGKPILAMMMDVAASGGYYIACACDEIHAHPTTVTGSIGVIMNAVNLSGTMAKLGLGMETIKSGPNKDAGSPFRSMTADERAIFQAMIDQMYARFVDVVIRGRTKLSRDQVLKLADGRIYTAQQAMEAGLVDRIGDLPSAIVRAKELARLKNVRVVTYQRPMSWHPNIYAQAVEPSVSTGQVPLVNLQIPSWLKPGGARFMYLWQPN